MIRGSHRGMISYAKALDRMGQEIFIIHIIAEGHIPTLANDKTVQCRIFRDTSRGNIDQPFPLVPLNHQSRTTE